MDTVLRKIKAQAIAAGVALVTGAGVYLTTDVDWKATFGPGAGAMVTVAVGFAVRESVPRIIKYLRKQDVTVIENPVLKED